LIQNTPKPTDPDKPLAVTCEVHLRTHPHVGDIQLISDSPEFVAWVKTLEATQQITLEAISELCQFDPKVVNP
jgi:hypothetical protein